MSTNLNTPPAGDNDPGRGFPVSEFEARLSRAQAAMAKTGLDGLFLTTETEIRYFTGFLTRFWLSPTRPWFLVVPAAGAPVAVIPSIGQAVMAYKGKVDYFVNTVFNYPTLAEAYKVAAFDGLNKL